MNQPLHLLYLLLAAIYLLSACSNDSDEPQTFTRASSQSYIETADLDTIKQHGSLRILVHKTGDDWLPRKGSPLHQEQALADLFADSLGLDAQLVIVEHLEQLIPALLDGKGDLIASNLTITEQRKQQIAFSVPIGHSREQLVGRAGDTFEPKSQRRIAVQKTTSYEDTLAQFQQQHPGIRSEFISGDLSTDDILDRLANKTIDLSIIDSNLLEQAANYRHDFKVLKNLTMERPLAWGLRQQNPQLLAALNRFLNQQQLTRPITSRSIDDFDKIKQSKKLRLITRNNAASYFLWRGELLGFEYELVKAFADQHKLQLEIIVAPDHQQLIPMLVSGQGDLIASFMTVTADRSQQGIAFSRPHHYATETLVSRINDNTIEQLDQLTGRSIYVRKSSAYWKTLKNLQTQGIRFKLIAAAETMETEEIIAKVASGEYDLTVADSHILNIELTWRDDIKASMSLGEPRQNAWAVRQQNTRLLSAINDFIKQQYKGLVYNLTYQKYFKNPHKIKRHKQQRIDLTEDGNISPYDSLVKKYAQQYGLDWRLLVSQMYQESRFNPKAKSWAGAKGLLQVMPRTAKELNLTNLEDPEIGIHAGVKYMHWVRQRFEPELDVQDRMWFTLAAYNAGHGHVKDARRLAKQMGWNPNRWFNHVEKALLLLSKPAYAKKARYGYVRGSEPVNYVKQIRNRYLAYTQITSSLDKTP